MKELLQFIMEGGDVVRYHTRPGIKPDTDARHSHGVAMLCSILAGTDTDGRTKASAMLLMAALTHDLAEQVASDVSAPSKRLLDIGGMLHAVEAAELGKYGLDYEQYLNSEEVAILKVADMFDQLLYCCRELALGNRGTLLIWRRAGARAEEMASSGELSITLGLRASAMYDAIKEIHHEAGGPTGPRFDVFDGGGQ